MMIAIESEGLFRTFMEFSFVLFLRVCSDAQDIFMLSFFDELLRCYWQCLGRERQGYVLHYLRKFSEFVLSLIKWVVAVLSAMLRKGTAGVWSFVKKKEHHGGGMLIKNRNIVF